MMKQSVNTAMYPRMTLRITPQKMDLGSVSEASLISSAIANQLSCFPMRLGMCNPTHMYGAVKAKHGAQRSEQAYHRCKTASGPTPTIVEV